METEIGNLPAVAQDVARALTAFVRLARARPLYSGTNKILEGMRDDVVECFTGLLRMVPEFSIKVRPEAFLFEDEPVFSERDVESSISFLFYRDGVRRLDFVRGLEPEELDVLLEAVQTGLSYRGMEDDLVSFLWHHDLKHVRYLTVDVAVVDAQTADVDVDGQVDVLLRVIYGDSDDDAGPRSVHLDATDLTAKSLAEELGSIDDMAPGFHPVRHLGHAPAYLASLAKPAPPAETERRDKAYAAALDAFTSNVHEGDVALAGVVLLRAFDSAVVRGDLAQARSLVDGVKQAEPEPRVAAWFGEALSEARTRPLLTIAGQQPNRTDEVAELLETAGPSVVPGLLAALPALPDPTQRRRFADLAITLGIDDRSTLHDLLQNDQGFVAREALYILTHLGELSDLPAVRKVQLHPKPQVRLALLEMLERMPLELAESVAIDLLEDREPRVRTAAADALVTLGSNRASVAIANAVQRPDLAGEPPSVKAAFMRAYVRLQRAGSLYLIQQLLDAADRRLATRSEEELAVATVQALASFPGPQALTQVKQAVRSRSKAVREAAKQTLEQMRQPQP